MKLAQHNRSHEKISAFVPGCLVFADFEEIFGTYTTDYYTPYAVREYLRNAGSVTIVKVGYIGGYIASSINLVVSGSALIKI